MPYDSVSGKYVQASHKDTAISLQISMKTRSSWLNCALRDDEAVYWVSIGHYEAVAVGIIIDDN